MVLLFARSGLYRDREQRPGFATVISSLFQLTLLMLLYAVIEGYEFSSYYIFYGALLFALVYVAAGRWVFERISGFLLHAAGYRRRAVLVGSGPNIEAVANALGDSSEIEPFGFVSPDATLKLGLRDFGTLDDLDEHFDAIDEVLIADPDFPQDQAVDLVDRCHRNGVRGARRAVDHGDPDGPGRVRARPGAAAVRAQAAGVRGRRLRRSSAVRLRRRRCCCWSCCRRCWP